MKIAIPVFAMVLFKQKGVQSFLPLSRSQSLPSMLPKTTASVKVAPLQSTPINTTFYDYAESDGEFSAYPSDDYRYAFMEPLLQWAVNSGVEFAPGTEIVAGDGGNWGIEIVKPQKQGAPILTVPSNLILSTQSLQRTPVYNWMKQNMPDSFYLPECLLVVKLLEEISKGGSSRWHTWIESLPTAFSTGMFLDSLEQSHVIRMAPKFLEQHERQWQTCNSLITKLARDSDDIIALSFRQWMLSQPNLSLTVQWAFSIVLTRSWRTADGSEATIVPIGDMFNHHSQEANVRPCYRERDNALQLCLTKDTDCSYDRPAGAYLSYGLSHQPARFLINFGFCDTTAPLIDAHVDRYLMRNGLPSILDEKVWPPFDPSHLVVSTQNGIVSEDVWIIFLLKILRERDPSQIQKIQSVYDNENEGALGALFDELFRDWELVVALELRDHFKEVMDNIYPAISFSKRELSVHPCLPMIERYNNFMRNVYLRTLTYLNLVVDQSSMELSRATK